jgi:two-component system phosphate regulon sensor histidine kinase PhoR
MTLNTTLEDLNISAQCKKYNLSLWQCPHFFFVIMGVVMVAIIITVYGIGLHFISDPQVIALVVLFLTAALFVITFVITKFFEKTAEANRLKSEFVSIVTHQLKSPLTSLSWAIEALISGEFGKVDEKQLEYLKILKENNSRMGELIKDLITVTKVEDGSQFKNRENFSLETITKDLLFKFQPFIQASNIDLKIKVDNNLPQVFTVVSQIKVVIENLIDNAIRYAKPKNGKKGTIEIFITKKENSAHFKIKDNGLGIPKDDQKYIFQKFFRSINVKEIQPYGSGLGLFITKSIIIKLGGKIGFKSEEGKGTTFWFTIPIK